MIFYIFLKLLNRRKKHILNSRMLRLCWLLKTSEQKFNVAGLFTKSGYKKKMQELINTTIHGWRSTSYIKLILLTDPNIYLFPFWVNLLWFKSKIHEQNLRPSFVFLTLLFVVINFGYNSSKIKSIHFVDVFCGPKQLYNYWNVSSLHWCITVVSTISDKHPCGT